MNTRRKDPLDRFLDWLETKLKTGWNRFAAYIRRLLFPLYLFPIKLVTYSLYYVLKFVWSFVVALLGIVRDVIVYPFTGMRAFLRSVGTLLLAVYLVLSVFVIADYLTRQYGFMGKFFCSFGARERVERAVVRVVAGTSQGTGFFISPNQVVTSFHVVAGEPSPKVILQDGTFVTTESMRAEKYLDMAVLTVGYMNPGYLPLPDDLTAYTEEPMMAIGYAWGTDLKGAPTVLRGNFIAVRESKKEYAPYIQTSISLVEGMSGGPLTDQCGDVIGINTMGLAGLSLFIPAARAKEQLPMLSDVDVARIDVNPSASPEDAVTAFYTYLKARRMEEGYGLLSREYLKKTSFSEWTGRFSDVLDVEIVLAQPHEGNKDTVFVMFWTQNWVDQEVDVHYYEGTWHTVQEDGVYKMNRSNIKEVAEPGWEWFYE